MEDEKWEIVTEGEPNFYFVKNKKTWLCRIQMNGDLSIKRQISIIQIMVDWLNFFVMIKHKIKQKKK